MMLTASPGPGESQTLGALGDVATLVLARTSPALETTAHFVGHWQPLMIWLGGIEEPICHPAKVDRFSLRTSWPPLSSFQPMRWQPPRDQDYNHAQHRRQGTIADHGEAWDLSEAGRHHGTLRGGIREATSGTLVWCPHGVALC